MSEAPADVLESLRHLQAVARDLADLCRQALDGRPEALARLPARAGESILLVEGLAARCPDPGTLERYTRATRALAGLVREVEDSQDRQHLVELEGRLSSAADSWVAAVEEVLRAVVAGCRP